MAMAMAVTELNMHNNKKMIKTMRRATWLVPTIIIILRATLVLCNSYLVIVQYLYLCVFVHLYFIFEC